MKFSSQQDTEEYIVGLMQPGETYTLRALAGLSGKLSYASMRNYVYGLVEQGRVEKLPYTEDRALVFTLPHRNAQGSPLFNFNGKNNSRQSLAMALKSFAAYGPQRPTKLMQLAPTFPQVIAHLYTLAARYSERVQVPVSEINAVKQQLLALKVECDRVSFVANQMLSNPGLWDKQNLPAMLINSLDPMSSQEAESYAAKVMNNFATE